MNTIKMTPGSLRNGIIYIWTILGLEEKILGYFLLYRTRRKKMSSSMFNMCGFTSSCARARSHPGLCTALIHYIVPNNSVNGQQRPGSDCAEAQSDLGLCCSFIPKNTFLHGAAHVKKRLQHRLTRGNFYF